MKLELANGSVIETISCGEAVRGKRAQMMAYFSDKLGCFVEHDGNKCEGCRHRYFVLDENDDRVYVRLEG